ncbi:hypothetical protein BJY16_003844 [Actinoplanes octamycinicus]|uniref:DUF1453 domain-containing protein n=1 Tax=Actinoplanes octamycinicus TaxID=135948 RepID=A0A7W7M808_9ACTN|nr:DUF1453 domain-containing protein [Actinoplanes octamycinicus]MBB4740385.1 hypothetical protein [Actinoplanes octamycinicus]GIE59646.1 hypothetical protein Aoc01nite_50480 [Actinoplanes octamycinicus]
MNSWVLASIIAVVLVVIVVKRLLGEPLNGRDLWAAPVILTAIGSYTLWKTDGLRPGDYAWLAGGIILGLALGYLRGSFVVVYEKRGFLWQRYRGRTFVAIIGSLLVMFAYALLADKLGMRPEARPIQLSIGISFIGEALAVTRQGLALGVRFAPERR